MNGMSKSALVADYFTFQDISADNLPDHQVYLACQIIKAGM